MAWVQQKTSVPGPESQRLARLMEQHVPRGLHHTTTIAISQGEGAMVTDVDGNRYIDFAGGIGALNVGHCAPEVVAAIKDQAEKYMHTCFHVFIYEPYIELAQRLNSLMPGAPKKTLLVNSGAEAVENAVKIARAYTKRQAVIAFEYGFHGRTLLSLSLTSQVKPYKFGFGPFAPEVYRVPFAYCYRCSFGLDYPACGIYCAEHLLEVFQTHVAAENVAAIIGEPVLGEGGFVAPPREFYPRLKEICQERGILMIADEIQSGFGRTGKWFAMEHFGMEADLVLTAKSMAGGTVLSAVTGRAEVMDTPQPGGLGGTYGGNPLACRAALATIDATEQRGLVARAAVIGDKVQDRFRRLQERYPAVGDVRGLGAMVGLELVKDRKTKEPATELTSQIRNACHSMGLILLTAGPYHNVIRTLMPLVITDDQLEEGLSILDTAFGELARS